MGAMVWNTYVYCIYFIFCRCVFIYLFLSYCAVPTYFRTRCWQKNLIVERDLAEGVSIKQNCPNQQSGRKLLWTGTVGWLENN